MAESEGDQSSELLRQIRQFSKARLQKAQTRYMDEDGFRFIETIDETGESHFERIEGENSRGYIVDYSPDLQVGEILPELFLSSIDVAGEVILMESLGITHILNVTSMKIENFPDKFVYKHKIIMDLPQTNIMKHLPECFTFIDEAIASGGHVLVHCMAGISRSSAVVIGYLMARRGMSYDDAFQHVKEKRPATKPNVGFVEQLRQFNPASDSN